jgi:hypothetical protein
VEEEKVGGGALSGQDAACFPTQDKAINRMYNLAHSLGYEDAVWL